MKPGVGTIIKLMKKSREEFESVFGYGPQKSGETWVNTRRQHRWEGWWQASRSALGKQTGPGSRNSDVPLTCFHCGEHVLVAFNQCPDCKEAAEQALREAQAELPSTFYADRDLKTRVQLMVNSWRRATLANQHLEAENEKLRDLIDIARKEWGSLTVPQPDGSVRRVRNGDTGTFMDWLLKYEAVLLSPSPAPAQPDDSATPTCGLCGRVGEHRTIVGGVCCDACRKANNWPLSEMSPLTAATTGKGEQDKITLENCGPENVEFNREWHLVSANRVSVYGKPYARPGEAISTANVGAWYEAACYWRDEAEKARSAELQELLHRYGRHQYHECLYKFVYDRQNPDGSYDGSGHWEHRGPITECRCGLAQALSPTPEVTRTFLPVKRGRQE